VTYRKASCDVQRAYANPALPRLDHRVSIRQPRRCGDLGEKQKGSDNPNSPLFLRAGTRGSLQGEKIARSALNGEQAPGREPQRRHYGERGRDVAAEEMPKMGGKHFSNCVCLQCNQFGGEHLSHCVCPYCGKLGGEHSSDCKCPQCFNHGGNHGSNCRCPNCGGVG
jgi:hypothetical protein